MTVQSLAGGLEAHLAALLLLLQRRAPSTTFRLIRQVGGIGLLPLGILDGSVIPTLGSLDLLTAYLAIRDEKLWPYYAAMATLGGVTGAALSYRLGHRVGRGWMERKLGPRRANQIAAKVENWGMGGIFISTVAPPPFPAAWFFLAAGAAHYPWRRFLPTVLIGRALRYCLITLIAAHYGRRFLRVLRHPAQYLPISLGITAAIVLVVGAFLYSRRRTQPASEA